MMYRQLVVEWLKESVDDKMNHAEKRIELNKITFKMLIKPDRNLIFRLINKVN